MIHHVGLRLEEDPAPIRAAWAVRRRIGSVLPPRTRKRISQRLNLELPPRPVWERLQHHYGYWQEKWGFDMLNPDMDAVLERWGHTEVCWRYDDDRRAAGEEIIAKWRSGVKVGVPIVSTNEGELLRHTLPLVTGPGGRGGGGVRQRLDRRHRRGGTRARGPATCGGTSATRSAGR